MNQGKFVTVTLSPSLQRTLVIHYLAEGYANRVEEPERLDPGGEGLRLARALRRLGADVHAVILLGRDATGRAYHALVAEEDLQVSVIYAGGTTPSDTCILDTGTEQETRIWAGEMSMGEEETQQLIGALEAVVEPDDTVILAGPLPPDVPEEIYGRLARTAHGTGAQLVLATEETALEEALPAKPELVALSQLACEALFNYPVRVLEDLVSSCRKLRQRGAQAALAETEDSGAILVTADGVWQVELPDKVRGTRSGIWEAMLAGFLSGRALQQPVEAALELGGAAAVHTANAIGVEFGSADEVEEHRPDVTVQALDIDEEEGNSEVG
jgi:1-phosphofructokinase